MDDFKIIIYILAAAAYFLLTQWRKAFKGGEDEEADVEPRRQHRQPAKPVTSFEDILRELQPKVEQARRQGQEVVQQGEERAKELVKPVIAKAETVLEAPVKYKSYETMAPRVLSWEKKAEAIEAAKNAALLRQESFKAYDRERPQANRYAALLRNPASAREAFVLSEIFKRKYD